MGGISPLLNLAFDDTHALGGALKLDIVARNDDGMGSISSKDTHARGVALKLDIVADMRCNKTNYLLEPINIYIFNFFLYYLPYHFSERYIV
jgi:hypothetical protein